MICLVIWAVWGVGLLFDITITRSGHVIGLISKNVKENKVPYNTQTEHFLLTFPRVLFSKGIDIFSCSFAVSLIFSSANKN